MASAASHSTSVLSKEDADKVAIAYTPRKFPATISKAASSFVAFRADNESSFKLDSIVAEQTGIADIERSSMEEKIERGVLERLKEVQERAYQEAYQLGLDAGKEQAFHERSAEFESKLRDLDEVMNSIERLKVDLVSVNESQIVSLVFYMAKRLVLSEIDQKPELVLELIRTAVDSAQSDENITIRLSPSDLQFIEGLKETLGKEFTTVKSAKLEASEDITSGGCIIETNYGDVNATLEQRIEKLWAVLLEKLPTSNNIVGS